MIRAIPLLGELFDIKEKLRLAYAGSAVRKVIASQQNEISDIARSAIGALTGNLLNTQFSQQEERGANDFGVMFLKQKGYASNRRFPR